MIKSERVMGLTRGDKKVKMGIRSTSRVWKDQEEVEGPVIRMYATLGALEGSLNGPLSSISFCTCRVFKGYTMRRLDVFTKIY